ncbi:hypothetical protein CR152_25795 [Massilia violaceinigra]|uniref:Uncharacterized protein n=1 Tax=Massilia violaceinigra TaxID=2045208 RepID=A0A2D2DRF7_9BURK|nr:hypothetical protein [Massilia violaceinigra]ATQ77533.1 hypothetical protein CR152_25795 [Massilia violaceinigra]
MSTININTFSKNAIAAILLTFAGAGVVSAATVTQFRSSGDYACASGITGPDRVAHLCVFSNKQEGTTTVFLNYVSFNLSDGGDFMYGNGEIPSSAFSATAKGASLSVVPSAVPGFVMEGSGHTGAIMVEWKPNGFSSSQFSGHGTYTYANGAFRQKWNGNSRDQSADTSGNFFGSNFAGFNSNFGSTANMTITFERQVPAPK